MLYITYCRVYMKTLMSNWKQFMFQWVGHVMLFCVDVMIKIYLVYVCVPTAVSTRDVNESQGLQTTWKSFLFKNNGEWLLVATDTVDCNGLSQVLKNREGFTAEVMEAFKYTFSQPGAFTAAINYHRNGFNSSVKEVNSNSPKIEKPILLIWVSIM